MNLVEGGGVHLINDINILENFYMISGKNMKREKKMCKKCGRMTRTTMGGETARGVFMCYKHWRVKRR